MPQKWLVREVLGDLKLGFKQDSLLRMYHQDAEEAYRKCMDLQKVFYEPELKNPERRYKSVITVGEPFDPMKAEKLLLSSHGASRLPCPWLRCP